MVVYGKGSSDVKVCQFVPSRYADGLVYFRRIHACSRTTLEMEDSYRYDVLYCMYACMYVCNLAMSSDVLLLLFCFYYFGR